MNAWLIGYAVCSVIAVILYIKELVKNGEIRVYHLFSLPFVAIVSPLFIFGYCVDNVFSATIWERK